MSNDYRNRNTNESGWYYSEEERYVPSGMMNESEHQSARERRSRIERSARCRRYVEQCRMDDSPYWDDDAQYQLNDRARIRNSMQYQHNDRPNRRREMDRSESARTGSGRIAKIVFVTSLSLLLLIVTAVVGVYAYVQNNILDRIDFVDDSQVTVTEEDLDSMVIEEDGDTGEGEELSENEAEALNNMINGGLVSEEDLYSEDGVTNVLLLGTDNRSFTLKGSRSDAIIIMSINDNTRQIVLTSIMRDVCVSIPGLSSVNKINAAHAYGGAPLAVRTVETNFGVDIDKHISVNFYAFMDVVDALGGIRMSVSESERKVMNDYIGDLNEHLGLARDNGKLNRSGDDLLLTGKQVLGYVRNRYTGNGDFSRTERQRKVLDQIIKECKNADVLTLLGVIEAAASYMSTNYEEGELVSLATNALDYFDYEVVTSRLPIDDSWNYARLNGMSIINIDINKNRRELINTVYGK